MAKMAVRDQATISYRTWFHLACIGLGSLVTLLQRRGYACCTTTALASFLSLSRHLILTMQMLVLLACLCRANVPGIVDSSAMLAVPHGF